MTTRRKFMALLGLGAAAGPQAAKEALDNSIATQAGISLVPQIPDMPGDWSSDSAIVKIADQIANFGMPEWYAEQLKEEGKHVWALSPDIANKRSWSMAVKIQTQKERNIGLRMEKFHRRVAQSRARLAFKAMTGKEWPVY